MNPAITMIIQNNLTYFLPVAMYARPWIVEDSKKFLIFAIAAVDGLKELTSPHGFGPYCATLISLMIMLTSTIQQFQ